MLTMLTSTDIEISGTTGKSMLCRFLAGHSSLRLSAGLANLRIRDSHSMRKSRDFFVCAALHNTYNHSNRKPSISVKRRPVPESPTEDEFFASNEATFAALGITPAVADSLQKAGYSRPSAVQAMAAGPILAGHDIVLAAETGSGKTYAYLAPVISMLLERKAAAKAVPQPLSQGSFGSPMRAPLDGALVLCPNATLCDQVVAFADSLLSTSGLPLVKTARVSGTLGPPRELPDIVVTTPAGLMGVTREFGDSSGYEWTRDGIVSRMRHVIVDEADELLRGGFEKDVKRIVAAFQGADKQVVARTACRELGISYETFLQLPRHIRRAAYEGGAKAMRTAGYKHVADSLQWDSPAESDQARRERPPDQAIMPSGGAAEGAAVPGGRQESPERPAHLVPDEDEWEGERSSEGAGPSGRDGLEGAKWRRQYILVAATMPVGEAGKSVGTEVTRLFPEARWLNGRGLHRSQRRLSHSWIAVDSSSCHSLLKEVVLRDVKEGSGRTLVFVGSSSAAQKTAEVLSEVGISAVQYHKAVPPEDRTAALALMSSRDGTVMVCTDAAARGIDIPNVTHVVQAEFASNAIDFLHRVGRTGRAGRSGRVTSFYQGDQEALVEAIREAVDAGQPVEGAFSRNRSFRKKIRRYGQYVPRGASGPAGRDAARE
eukprot:jgi/Botrbrau1/8338/Bobra.0081s0026.1